MNQLIAQFFGDPYISLDCSTSECVRNGTSTVPDDTKAQAYYPWILALVGIVIVVLYIVKIFAGEEANSPEEERHLPDRNVESPPCDFYFNHVSYSVGETGTDQHKQNLLVSGLVKAGVVIMIVVWFLLKIFAGEEADSHEEEGLLPDRNAESPPGDFYHNEASYTVGETGTDQHKQILLGVSGLVKAGEVMAIMGSSGNTFYTQFHYPN